MVKWKDTNFSLYVITAKPQSSQVTEVFTTVGSAPNQTHFSYLAYIESKFYASSLNILICILILFVHHEFQLRSYYDTLHSTSKIRRPFISFPLLSSVKNNKGKKTLKNQTTDTFKVRNNTS